jgi:hypothetical protein
LGDDDGPCGAADDARRDAGPELASAPSDHDEPRATIARELEDSGAWRTFEDLSLGGNTRPCGGLQRTIERLPTSSRRLRQAALVDRVAEETGRTAADVDKTTGASSSIPSRTAVAPATAPAEVPSTASTIGASPPCSVMDAC